MFSSSGDSASSGGSGFFDSPEPPLPPPPPCVEVLSSEVLSNSSDCSVYMSMVFVRVLEKRIESLCLWLIEFDVEMKLSLTSRGSRSLCRHHHRGGERGSEFGETRSDLSTKTQTPNLAHRISRSAASKLRASRPPQLGAHGTNPIPQDSHRVKHKQVETSAIDF